MLNSIQVNELLAKIRTRQQDTKEKSQVFQNLDELQSLARQYFGDDRVISSDEISESLGVASSEPKYFSGWKGLDDILGGFRPAQLVVISAPTKNGKTQWAMELSQKMNATNPLWFLFEESSEEIIRKHQERGMPLPKFYSPKSLKFNDSSWIEERIIESIAKHHTQVVFIDHLDFIVPFNTGGERHDLMVAKSVRELKQIANRWKITIVLICHLTKTEMLTTPSLENLRGSASIAQEADTVIMLWRITKKGRKKDDPIEVTNDVRISIMANRRTGTTGNFTMTFRNNQYLPVLDTDAFDDIFTPTTW